MDPHNPHKVNKERLMVVLVTQDYRVEGEVHLQPASRLTDFVNNKTEEHFIAVTNAEVISLSRQEAVSKVEYLALNKSDIIMVYPLESSQ
jgi:hypothetical protein